MCEDDKWDEQKKREKKKVRIVALPPYLHHPSLRYHSILGVAPKKTTTPVGARC